MSQFEIFQHLAISVMLGLLVGLQRERTQSGLAGFRTFPLITVMGTLCGILSAETDSPWILAAGLLGVVTLTLVGNLPSVRSEPSSGGVTTEAALLVMFLTGAYVTIGAWSVAAAIAGGVAILLQFKPEMRRFASQLGEHDFRAILQFVLITFIILPILPNRALDPLDPIRPLFPDRELGDLAVVNPHEIWLLVVLVVGISLAGYVIYKLFGANAGVLLGGLLGGVISSTATTASYSRRAKSAAVSPAHAAVVILLASSVVYVRVLLEIAVAAPGLLRAASGPILIMLGFATLMAITGWIMHHEPQDEMPPQSNPSEIKAAIVFAAIYSAVLIAVAVGRMLLPPEALYVIAGLSGMSDMDAITLSTARLVHAGRLDQAIAWRLIVVAAMSNLFFKGLIVLFVGPRALAVKVGVPFALSILCGLLLIWLWP